MYGIILLNMKDYVISKFGQKKWDDAISTLKLESTEFGVYEPFPEGLVQKMGKKCMHVLDMKDEEFYEGMGAYFVKLVKELKVDKVIFNLGRNLRDFCLNLDNLHDYMKLQFPRMKAPSFFVCEETEKSKYLMIPQNLTPTVIFKTHFRHDSSIQK